MKDLILKHNTNPEHDLLIGGELEEGSLVLGFRGTEQDDPDDEFREEAVVLNHSEIIILYKHLHKVLFKHVIK
jgi:hypothetical protein